MVSLNLHRRHLDESQRGMVGARLANLAHGQKKADASIEASVTQDEAADLLNTSRGSIQRATKVLSQGTRTDLAQICAMSQTGRKKKLRISAHFYNRELKCSKLNTTESLFRCVSICTTGDAHITRARLLRWIGKRDSTLSTSDGLIVTGSNGKENRKPHPLLRGRVSTLECGYFTYHEIAKNHRLDVPCLVTLFESTDLKLTPYAGDCNRKLWEKRYSLEWLQCGYAAAKNSQTFDLYAG